jgi:hypothetical protein
MKWDAEIVESLVTECFGTHMIKVFVLMAGMEDDEALFSNAYTSLDHS